MMENINCADVPIKEIVLTCFNPLQNRTAIAVIKGRMIRSERFMQRVMGYELWIIGFSF
jgi:hypothetical protein